jgi:hypothetical protein
VEEVELYPNLPQEPQNADGSDPEYEPESANSSGDDDDSDPELVLQPHTNPRKTKPTKIPFISSSSSEPIQMDLEDDEHTAEDWLQKILRGKKEDGTPFVQCPICHRQLSVNGSDERTTLKRHLEIHSGNRKYGCPHCPKRFRQERVCRAHIKCIHLNIRPFACKFCDKKFYNPQHRKSHEMVKFHSSNSCVL